MAKTKVENLSLKVMRLAQPSFALSSSTLPFSHSASTNITEVNEISCKMLERSNNDTIMSTTLTLPQSFGCIYLGETFVCSVRLHNISNVTFGNINLRYDLQTASQKLPLLQFQEITNNELISGGAIDQILSHEVKECGVHILVCEVNYNSLGGQKLNFRKYFKFQVALPLDIKTKFCNADSNHLLLETQVQNITTEPMCLEKVELEPSHMLQVMSLNHLPSSGAVEENAQDKNLVFGQFNYLHSQDSRQYLFSLTPRDELRLTNKQRKQLDAIINVGKLDISWRTNLGGKGRLQTSQLQRIAPNQGDIILTVVDMPSKVCLFKCFKIVCSIFNNLERTLDLEMTLENRNKPRILWTGSCYRKLGLVEPSGTLDVVLEVVPQCTALQSISGIRIKDNLLMKTYEFDDICHVYVVKDEI